MPLAAHVQSRARWPLAPCLQRASLHAGAAEKTGTGPSAIFVSKGFQGNSSCWRWLLFISAAIALLPQGQGGSAPEELCGQGSVVEARAQLSGDMGTRPLGTVVPGVRRRSGSCPEVGLGLCPQLLRDARSLPLKASCGLGTDASSLRSAPARSEETRA